MAYKIKHSQLAELTFQQNIIYLEKEWSLKEIKNFINKTQDVIEILKIDPFVFSLWEFNNKIRKVAVLKQITMFYEIEGKSILIHLFWNNYQSPDIMKSLLEME